MGVCGAGTVTGIKAVCTHHVIVASKSDTQGGVISAILLDFGRRGRNEAKVAVVGAWNRGRCH